MRMSYEGFVVAPVDRPWVLALLRRHPWWSEKSGDKADDEIRVVVKHAKAWGDFCYHLQHLDALGRSVKEVDISWVYCLKRPTPLNFVTRAFRRAVEGRILEFKMGSFAALGRGEISEIRCDRTGQVLETWKDTLVDHHSDKMTFKRLLDDFSKVEGINLEGVETRAHNCGGCGEELVDLELSARWQQYHKTNAILRLVSWKSERGAK